MTIARHIENEAGGAIAVPRQRFTIARTAAVAAISGTVGLASAFLGVPVLAATLIGTVIGSGAVALWTTRHR